MSTKHVVKSGETLSQIAFDFGFRNWELIWNHDANSADQNRPGWAVTTRCARFVEHVLLACVVLTGLIALFTFEFSIPTSGSAAVAVSLVPRRSVQILEDV